VQRVRVRSEVRKWGWSDEYGGRVLRRSVCLSHTPSLEREDLLLGR
jgi:hypothetical protein